MIYAIGDNFTYGEELNSQEEAWPYLLSQLLDQPIKNIGRPGSNNHRSVKRAIDCVLNGSATMIIIGWTDPSRLEFADQGGTFTINSGTRGINRYPGYREKLAQYHTIHDIDEYHYTNWLRQIVLMQALCELHKVKLLQFISCGAHMLNDEFLPAHQNLAQHVSINTFVGWPDNAMQYWTFHQPRGPGGHTLQEGHQLTAEKFYEHIRNIGWLS
jgi:hypothetical protein